MRFLRAVIGVAALALGAAQAATRCAASDPSQLARERRRRPCSKNSTLIAPRIASRPFEDRRLVEKDLLPHFDIDYAARLVLGAHWRDATPEQRERFVDAFYHSTASPNYGNSLIELHGGSAESVPDQDRIGSESRYRAHRSEARRWQTVPVNLQHAPRAETAAGRPGMSSSTASATSRAFTMILARRSTRRDSTR